MISHIHTFLNANINARTYGAITISEGAIKEYEYGVNERRINIPKNSTDVYLQYRNGPKWQDVAGAVLTQAQVRNFVNFINNNSFQDNAHRGIITNAAWRTFYRVQVRPLSYIDRTGAPSAVPIDGSPAPDTVPCFDCGLVLPIRSIEIDHQRPFAGNDLESVCKVFRSIGLTKDGPDGVKGLNISGIHALSVNGQASRNIGTLKAKYTLNDIGKILFTLIDWRSEYTNLLESCRNHLVNLRPLCGACNTPNRNVRHY